MTKAMSGKKVYAEDMSPQTSDSAKIQNLLANYYKKNYDKIYFSFPLKNYNSTCRSRF